MIAKDIESRELQSLSVQPFGQAPVMAIVPNRPAIPLAAARAPR
jgi:hypothetical protein